MHLDYLYGYQLRDTCVGAAPCLLLLLRLSGPRGARRL